MDWNPNDPRTLGMEWVPTESGGVSLDSRLKAAAVSLDASVAEAIPQIGVPNTSLPIRGGVYAIEVYNGESAVPSGSAVSVFARPNEDVSRGSWIDQASGTTTLYARIDETATDTADLIKTSGSENTYTGRFNSAALALTGKRIISVSLGWSGVVGPAATLRLGLNVGGVTQQAGIYYGPTANPWTTSFTWPYNPTTRKPWTIADVQAFDSTDSWWAAGATYIGWSAVVLYNVWLEVLTVDENRLAVGTLDDTSSALVEGDWNFANVVTPTGGTWTKNSPGRFLVTTRRLNDIGVMVVPYLDSGADSPHASGWAPSLLSAYGTVSDMGSRLTRVQPVITRLTGAVDSVDSTPYVQEIAAPVWTGHSAQQEISGADGSLYGILRALIDPGNAVSDLSIRVRRRSDNVQVGATLAVTANEASNLADAGNGWRWLVSSLPTAGVLAAGTQYYLEFTSTASTAAEAWHVAQLDTWAKGDVASLGGTADAATLSGVESTRYDLIASISTVPPVPSFCSATMATIAAEDTVCCPTDIDRAEVAWGVTTLGAQFDHYEIQRSDDAGVSWATVALSSVEAYTDWFDYEGVRGLASRYRVRVIRTDGAASDWQTSNLITKPVRDNSLYLVSNFNPSYALAYDYRPARSYDFSEDDERVLVGIYGRDYQLGFQPTEYRGTTAHFTLLVGVDTRTPAGGKFGAGAFAPLRQLARAPLPYICVLDHLGNRMYAMLRVPSGDLDAHTDTYLAELVAVELTGEPYPVPVNALLEAQVSSITDEAGEGLTDERGESILQEGV